MQFSGKIEVSTVEYPSTVVTWSGQPEYPDHHIMIDRLSCESHHMPQQDTGQSWTFYQSSADDYIAISLQNATKKGVTP